MNKSCNDTNAEPLLSVIIVNFNVREYLDQALQSIIKALSSISHEILVVDNHSADGSCELVAERYPAVHLVANNENLGFGAANNQALLLAKGQFISLINPDTLVQEDTFEVLTKRLKADPSIGMIGCRILNPDGTLQLACRRSYPTPWVAFTKLVGLSRLFPHSALFARYNLTYLDPDEAHDVDAISGSFMTIRREVLEQVGLLDEKFFMYGEDLDWCYRTRQAGWRVHYTPATQIIHYKGESSRKSGLNQVWVFYQAMVLFVNKHFRRRYLFFPVWVLQLAIWGRATLTLLARGIRPLSAPAFDLVLISGSLLTAVYWRFGSFAPIEAYKTIGPFYAGVWMGCLAVWGAYGRYRFSVLMGLGAATTGLVLNASLTFFLNQYAFSRAVVLLSGGLIMITVAGWRFALKYLPWLDRLHGQDWVRSPAAGNRTIIVGTEDAGQMLREKLESRLGHEYNVVGYVTLSEDVNGSVNGLPVLGPMKQIEDLIARHRVHQVIFSSDEVPYKAMLEIVARTRHRHVDFKLVPSSLEVIIGKASIDRIEDIPLLEIACNLEKPSFRLFKRLFDVSVAGWLLLLVSPIVAWRICFRGLRIHRRSTFGPRNQPVTVLELADRNGVAREGWIDKSPRLLSVLKGDLSLVGTEVQETAALPRAGSLPPLKPGLTGLAQLNRDLIKLAEDRERYDLYYLKNYSPMLDFEILSRALMRRLRGGK